MEESRLQRLENQVSVLREDRASDRENISHLSDTVEKLASNVEGLTAALNKGRGALWSIGSGAAILGAAGSWAAGKLFGVQ